MTAQDFWYITPWQFRLFISANIKRFDAEHDQRAWHMWHTAMLSGIQGRKFPPLKQFLSSSKKQANGYNKPDEKAFLAGLKAYSERYKQKHGTNSQT